MSDFKYKPSDCIPFRDAEAIARVRRIKREDMDKHPNPEFKIRIVPDAELGNIFVTDMFYQIKTAADEGRQCVLILPNPAHAYRQLAHMINRFRVNCAHVHVFIMDEYADQDGAIAPDTWPLGFMYSFKKFFFQSIDSELRPPQEQLHAPTNSNISDYGKMIEDLGGADACYTGPGWTGHLAFIEPDCPEFAGTLDEWKQMGARVVTLSPFTIAQNSLHGFFGMSGDLAAVPPKAATIGPAEVIASKYRIDMSGLSTMGTVVSWQRMITRLCTHGPVTPQLPTSIHQELSTDKYITETLAMDIEPMWEMGY